MATVLKVAEWDWEKSRVKLVSPASAHRPEMGQWFDFFGMGCCAWFCWVGRYLFSMPLEGGEFATRNA